MPLIGLRKQPIQLLQSIRPIIYPHLSGFIVPEENVSAVHAEIITVCLLVSIPYGMYAVFIERADHGLYEYSNHIGAHSRRVVQHSRHLHARAKGQVMIVDAGDVEPLTL